MNSSKKFDVIVIGMGPSSIFCAYELIQLGKAKKVLLIEQGKRVENRVCPIEKTGKCTKCKPFCNITSGFSGAGAFSDGKLSLYNPEDDDIYVGGNLHKYIGVKETKKLIDYTDKIYLKFGADKKLEGVEFKEEVTKIRQKAQKERINLIDIPIRHLGTEKAHELYEKLEKYLEENNITMLFETEVKDLIIEDNKIKGVVTKSVLTKDAELQEFYSNKVVMAVGRKGANWLSDMCKKHNIETRAGVVDIGVRYELPDEVMKNINKYMYEGKFIGYPYPFKDKVRTFCQNPSGFVASEVYDNNLTLVNGHSYKDRKSTNTNLAILVSHNFTHPFNKPIEYGRNVAKNLNELGQGNVVVQRLGDINRGKRTWQEELDRNTVVPTLKSAVPGDITFAIGYRTMTDILQFIKEMDKIVEGFANPDNLLYGPEIKFYSNKVLIDERFETSVKGLYSIGDGGGMTRGLMMASASGIQMARNL
ncbi:MAG: FAD-binding protein [Clostridia bacterium]|nr:FAD-binding protein [Clostridia bacterium]MBR4261500.1 FAD-binding protein [Clostridia bacterium]